MWIKELDLSDNGPHEVLISLNLVRAITKSVIPPVNPKPQPKPGEVPIIEVGAYASTPVIIFLNFDKEPTYLTYASLKDRDEAYERIILTLGNEIMHPVYDSVEEKT